MDKFIDIQVQVSEEILDKYLLYYPSREAVADEILKQIAESNVLITGKALRLKWRPYKGGKDTG